MPSNNLKDQKFIVLMDRQLHEKLRNYSFYKRQTMADTVRLSLNQYLADYKNERQ